MERIVKKYAQKLINAGLAPASGHGAPVVGGLDDRLFWNRNAPETPFLEQVFNGLNINSLVFFRPASPYNRIISFLAEKALPKDRPIRPHDCETRTFLHDLPVTDRLESPPVIDALKRRKSLIILTDRNSAGFREPAIIAPGTVSPEQGFVSTSSVCFACFVKFFSDYMDRLQSTLGTDPEMDDIFDLILPEIDNGKTRPPDLMKGPFSSEEDVYAAVIQAGRKTVEYGLVDSYFGNVSFCWNDTLYISQTGSSLDELAGCIDPVPLDGSSSAGLTASSELTAHLETIEKTGFRAILHGHPRFSVIQSMNCDPGEKAGCRFRDKCHILCPKQRSAAGAPIVPGEVGTGPYGLCNTLPRAFDASDCAIVYGHGLFTIGRNDFQEAFSTLLRVENDCRRLYLKTAGQLRTG